jgi:hypothetical protein
MTIRLELEVVRADLLVEQALPALHAARVRKDGAPLAAAARTALKRLRPTRPEGPAYDPEVLAFELSRARLEALLATGAPPESEAAFEEVAWALLRAARAALPATIDDWDLLRVLLDPERRRREALGAVGRTLGAAAIVGSGPLGLARNASYATGWNPPGEAARVARALGRFTPRRLERLARAVPIDVARTVYPRRTSPLVRRLPRALAALERLQAAYDAAAREGAGVFVELALV